MHQRSALLGEVTVAAKVSHRHGLSDIIKLFASDEGFVKGNLVHLQEFCFNGLALSSIRPQQEATVVRSPRFMIQKSTIAPWSLILFLIAILNCKTRCDRPLLICPNAWSAAIFRVPGHHKTAFHGRHTLRTKRQVEEYWFY